MDNLQPENGFPVNPIRVGDGIVFINIFSHSIPKKLSSLFRLK